MSLKFNPFDQKPKGNLVKRRKINESVSQTHGSPNIDLKDKTQTYQINSQLDDNKNTISSQLDVKLEDDYQLTTNSKPTQNTLATTNRLSIEALSTTNQLPIDYQLINSQLDDNKNTISSQTSLKKLLDSHLPIWKHLGPAQGSVLILLYKKCDFNSLETELLGKNIISNTCNISEKSVGTTIARLLRLELIHRLKGRRGVSGYMQFFFTKEVYKKMKSDGADTYQLVNTNKNTIDSQLDDELEHNKKTDPSSMYVGINNDTIHTNENQNGHNQMAEVDPWIELRDVDFSSTEQFSIRSNVIETFKKNKWVITREQLEEHLERFVRYFTENEFEKRREPIKNPYSFFLSSIKAISKGEPDPICDIETQFEILQKMALQNKIKSMEIRRREFEAIEKQMDQYRNSEFEHWVLGLSDEDKTQIVPPNKIAELGSGRYKILLKDYFNQTVWPEIKQSVLNGHRS
jgi:hypothetical protein